MKTSTILLLVLGYIVFQSMGKASAPQLPPKPPQPQAGGDNTFNQVLGVIQSGLKTVDTYMANDRNAPNSNV